MAYSSTQYISGSAGLSMRVEGLTETIAMLDEVPKALVLAGFTGAFRAAGNVFLGELATRTPVRSVELWNDEAFAAFRHATGGDLKAALMSEITLDANYRGGMVEVGYGKFGYIANMVEYGHRMLSHKKQSISGPMALAGQVRPYPFMRPGFEASKERAIDAFAASIADTVSKLKSAWGLPSAA